MPEPFTKIVSRLMLTGRAVPRRGPLLAAAAMAALSLAAHPAPAQDTPDTPAQTDATPTKATGDETAGTLDGQDAPQSDGKAAPEPKAKPEPGDTEPSEPAKASEPADAGETGDRRFPEGTPSLAERLALDPVDGSLGVFARDGADTRVELYPCAPDEAKLCGRIVWLRRLAEEDGSIRRDVKNPDEDLRERPLIGLEVLWDLSSKKGDQAVWTGGRIYNPDDGNDYRARLSFEDGNMLRLKACLLVICETQIWRQHSGPAEGTDAAADARNGTADLKGASQNAAGAQSGAHGGKEGGAETSAEPKE